MVRFAAVFVPRWYCSSMNLYGMVLLLFERYEPFFAALLDVFVSSRAEAAGAIGRSSECGCS